MRNMNDQDAFKNIIDIYLEKLNVSNNYELEVKFGTRGIKRTTRNNYDNIIKHLLSIGFATNYSENHSLKIHEDFVDARGRVKESNIRVEIDGLSNIEQYCKTNDLKSLKYRLTQKQNVKYNDNYINSVNYPDYNFSVSLASEDKVNLDNNIATQMVHNWKNTKKSFRLINRSTLFHATLPVQVDISIVKESRKRGRDYIMEYTFQDADILNAPESYEIEIEVRNDSVKELNISSENILSSLKKTIRYILAGYQETNYPISYTKMKNYIQEYSSISFGTSKDYLRTPDFIGPSSYTLQLSMVSPINENFKKLQYQG